jgi:hypothetical protein
MVDTQQDENAPDDRQHDSNPSSIVYFLISEAPADAAADWIPAPLPRTSGCPWIHQDQLQGRRHPLRLIAMD